MKKLKNKAKLFISRGKLQIRGGLGNSLERSALSEIHDKTDMLHKDLYYI